MSLNGTFKVLGLSLILFISTWNNSAYMQAQVVNPGDDVFVIVASTAQVAAAANSKALLYVTSNTTWTAASNQSWLSVSPNTATFGNAQLTLTASANTGADRVAEVTLSAVGVAAKKITVTQKAAPIITSFTPDKAGKGTTVTITGTYFTAATSVTFGETAAKSFTVDSDTQISAIVNAGTTGTISVTTAGGTATSSETLTWVSGIISTAGKLEEIITNAGLDKSTLTELTITGNIDARDFRFMRDDMLKLAVLDLSGATFVSYRGSCK